MKQGVDEPARRHEAKDDEAPELKPPPLDRMRRMRVREATRNQFLNALPDIAAALVKGAREGKVQHLKLLIELGVLEKGMLKGKRAARKDKSVASLLMEQFQLDQQERAAERTRADADG